MDEKYLERGKEVLKILISNGYEAYFIGGVVRSAILAVDCRAIDITTSATPDAIKVIFAKANVDDYKPGSVKMVYDGYVFYLSTFRKEEYTDRRTPTRYHYSRSLLEDLSRRDYTINAIAMSHSGKLTDAYDGFKDIKTGKVRCIGKPRSRYNEDPLRILRGIRFVSELNFDLVKGLNSAMKSKAKLINGLELEEVVEELKKIVEGKYAKRGFKTLVSTNVYKYLPTLRKGIAKQAKKYHRLNWEEFLLLSFVLSENLDEDYLDFVDNIEIFKREYNLILTNPKCKFDTLTLFSYGLDACLVANKINRILRRSHNSDKIISKAHNALIIKKTCDLAFKGQDILDITKGQSGEYIQVLVDNIIYKVLTRELPNDYDAIKQFCLDELEQNGITPYDEASDYQYHDGIVGKKLVDDEDGLISVDELNKVLDGPVVDTEVAPIKVESSLDETSDLNKDFTDHRIDMLEKRLNEQEKQIHEKDEQLQALMKESRQTKIKKDVDQMVKGNLDLINDMDYINASDEEKAELTKKLQKVYLEFINSTEDNFNDGDED